MNAAIADITRDLAKLAALPDGYAFPDMVHLVPGAAPDLPEQTRGHLPTLYRVYGSACISFKRCCIRFASASLLANSGKLKRKLSKKVLIAGVWFGHPWESVRYSPGVWLVLPFTVPDHCSMIPPIIPPLC